MATRKTLNKHLAEGKITQDDFELGMEELREKSKERRANRRANWKKAALEIMSAIEPKTFDKLSDDAKHLLQLLSGDPVARALVTCQIGDKLVDLLQKYQDVKDCYGKLARYCEKNGMAIDMATATIVAK